MNFKKLNEYEIFCTLQANSSIAHMLSDGVLKKKKKSERCQKICLEALPYLCVNFVS